MNARVTSSRIALSGASLLLAAVALAGCSSVLTPTAPATAIAVSGNWQFASTAASASNLPALSGELTGSNQAMTGLFHSDAASACVAPSQVFEMTGSANAKNEVTLTGANSVGGKLTVTGTLAADGKSLTNAAYSVSGGSCAMAQPADASAQQYTVSANYSGTFSDPDGQVIALTAVLSQSTTPDQNGNFTLTGTGTFPSNPCFNSPVSVTASELTGNTFNFTYQDPTTLNSVAVAGNISTDGSTLNVTQWTLTGSCGPDSGTGVLTQVP
jgi:hypothetical protein